MLPVKYANAVPELGDEVVFTGSFAESSEGTIFEAKTFEVKRNIMRLISRQ